MKKLPLPPRYVLLLSVALVVTVGAAPPTIASQVPGAGTSPAPALAGGHAPAEAALLPGITSAIHGDHAHPLLAASPIGATDGESAPATNAAPQDDPNTTVDPELLGFLSYRSTGFNRGGRSTAVAGLSGDHLTYFAGYTGGGVWKTADAGISWENVSDGFFNVGSIGDIKVAPSDPNVIWVGTGSGCPRGNISTGDGIYRSTDGGKTWAHVWSPGFVQVPEMVVHPADPDVLYAAVLGNIFGPNEERGIYKTEDGGQTWERILYVSDQTGFNDIEMDPSNPRILFATSWTVYRKPWTIHSGSDEGGVYRSKDAGATWEKLGGGLPTGMVGKVDVTVSPPNPDRVWALVEAPGERGGVYRSDNGGDSWSKINGERKLLQRAWYYIHIYADPVDPDTVYALNTGFYKSTDGGRTFPTSFSVRHGDNHDLWLNPNNPAYMVNSNDGGANVSLNAGGSWSEQMNQPTAEFYRVTVDDSIPYQVFGAQQDNSTAAMSAAGGGNFFGGGANFYAVGGGESGHIAVDPRGSDVIWAGSYGGSITRMDRRTGVVRNVRSYEDSQTGQQAADMKYRFQWNAPIRISPHDPDTVYHASQYVHRTRDAGVNWEVISPDLTTDDITKQGYSGGEGITRDNTGVEVYTTIFALEESPYTAGLLWAGSDDGLMHVSRDNGTTWEAVTPSDMPEGGTINMIDLSAHDPGRAHIAVYKYREQDFRPYIFQTNDYGASWTLLTDGTNGIPDDHFVRVVREDPNRRGLLFAGTEFGMYVSFDDGAHWQSFQLNLPVTPVTDMVITDDDLVLSTQGRAFWVLDNFSALSQLTDAIMDSPAHLFAPRTAYKGGRPGPQIYFWVAEGTTDEVRLEIVDPAGETVLERSGRVSAEGGEEDIVVPAFVPPEFRQQFIEMVRSGGSFGGMDMSQFMGGGLSPTAGINRSTWNGRWPAIYEVPQGIVQWGGFGGGGGPGAVPGTYEVRLTVGERSMSQPLELLPDPRVEATTADYEEQLRIAREVGAAAKLLYDELAQLRSVKTQAAQIGRQLAEAGYGNEASQAAGRLSAALEAVEGELTQLEGEGGQDALNFPGRLDNQFNTLYGAVSGGTPPVSSGVRERWQDLQPQLQPLLDRIRAVYDEELESFNELVSEHGMRVLLRRQE